MNRLFNYYLLESLFIFPLVSIQLFMYGCMHLFIYFILYLFTYLPTYLLILIIYIVSISVFRLGPSKFKISLRLTLIHLIPQ